MAEQKTSSSEMSLKSAADLLGVKLKALNLAELKQAYRKQAGIHHPDKGGNQEKFQDIVKANDMLSAFLGPEQSKKDEKVSEQEFLAEANSNLTLARGLTISISVEEIAGILPSFKKFIEVSGQEWNVTRPEVRQEILLRFIKNLEEEIQSREKRQKIAAFTDKTNEAIRIAKTRLISAVHNGRVTLEKATEILPSFAEFITVKKIEWNISTESDQKTIVRFIDHQEKLIKEVHQNISLIPSETPKSSPPKPKLRTADSNKPLTSATTFDELPADFLELFNGTDGIRFRITNKQEWDHLEGRRTLAIALYYKVLTENSTRRQTSFSTKPKTEDPRNPIETPKPRLRTADPNKPLTSDITFAELPEDFLKFFDGTDDSRFAITSEQAWGRLEGRRELAIAVYYKVLKGNSAREQTSFSTKPKTEDPNKETKATSLPKGLDLNAEGVQLARTAHIIPGVASSLSASMNSITGSGSSSATRVTEAAPDVVRRAPKM